MWFILIFVFKFKFILETLQLPEELSTYSIRQNFIEALGKLKGELESKSREQKKSKKERKKKTGKGIFWIFAHKQPQLGKILKQQDLRKSIDLRLTCLISAYLLAIIIRLLCTCRLHHFDNFGLGLFGVLRLRRFDSYYYKFNRRCIDFYKIPRISL